MNFKRLIDKTGKAIISGRVTKIDDYAFEDCSGLTSIEVPDSVTEIGKEAFKNCAGLTHVIIPEDTELGEVVFDGCEKVKIEYY